MLGQRGIAQVLVLLLIIGGVIGGVYLVQQRTNWLPKADSSLSVCNPKEKDDLVVSQTWTKVDGGTCNNGKRSVRYQCGKKKATVKETCPIASTTPKPTDSPKPESSGVVCTQEVKQCRDGSYVGRIPPSCNFAACPTPTPKP